MRFQFTAVASWPPLAWLARCRRGESTITVLHGAGVEARPDWFGEVVWDGDYEAGDLDATDIVFGSGCRLRDGRAVFVSSASTLDRLHSLQSGPEFWLSNSLACLLAGVGGELDPAYSQHMLDLRSIVKGLRRYKRALETSAGRVSLTYYDNLVWDGVALTLLSKPNPVRRFECFDPYRTFVSSALERLGHNLACEKRRYSYSMLGTISSGYDSPAVAALAKDAGLGEVITFSVARGGGSDSGAEIAEAMGLQTILIERDAWRDFESPEVPFLAADGNGGDVLLKGAEHLLAHRVLLTGFHGDVVWHKRPKMISDDFARTDQSGLSLSEYRLWAGFIHCPVPFFGARQHRDIVAISNSPEMSQWDTAPHYSRPICRRIVEEVGVPRGLFGVEKKAGAVRLSARDVFWSSKIPGDYLRWLDTHAAEFLRRHRMPPQLVSRVVRPVQSVLGAVDRAYPVQWRRSRLAKRIRLLAGREYLYKFLFAWAVARAKCRYMDASLDRTTS